MNASYHVFVFFLDVSPKDGNEMKDSGTLGHKVVLQPRKVLCSRATARPGADNLLGASPRPCRSSPGRTNLLFEASALTLPFPV